MIYIPDGKEEKQALARTTHLCIAAHEDDIEFMAYTPIAECFGKQDKWFCEVVVTDGAGSPRNGLYADYTEERCIRNTFIFITLRTSTKRTSPRH